MFSHMIVWHDFTWLLIALFRIDDHLRHLVFENACGIVESFHHDLCGPLVHVRVGKGFFNSAFNWSLLYTHSNDNNNQLRIATSTTQDFVVG